MRCLSWVSAGRSARTRSRERARQDAVAGQQAERLDVEDELRRRALDPQLRVPLRGKRVVGGVDLDQREAAGVEAQAVGRLSARWAGRTRPTPAACCRSSSRSRTRRFPPGARMPPPPRPGRAAPSRRSGRQGQPARAGPEAGLLQQRLDPRADARARRRSARSPPAAARRRGRTRPAPPAPAAALSSVGSASDTRPRPPAST